MRGKPEEVFAVGFVAIGQDYKDNYIKELVDFELLMLVADPEKGESYPWGAQGRYHRAYDIRSGRVRGKLDGFNSTFTDPAHEKYWQEVLDGNDDSGSQYKFRMKKVKVTLRISDVEANAIESNRIYLSEILTGMHEAIVTISPRSKQPIVHREGQRDTISGCIIIEDSEWKDFVYPPETASVRQCEGKTIGGNRCKKPVVASTVFCAQHAVMKNHAKITSHSTNGKEEELATNPV